jgi:uroporphyrinogen decarboxylase
MAVRYDDKENFSRVISFSHPSHVSYPPPSRGLVYHGAWPGDTRPSPNATQWRDLWGVGWTERDGEAFPTLPALASFEEIDGYRAPDAFAPERFAETRRQAAGIDRHHYFVSANHPYFLYEKGFNVMGPGQFLMLLLADPDRAHHLLDTIVGFELDIARQYVTLQPDHVNLSDDYGMQNSLAMSLDTWREFFKPRIKRMIDFYRSALGGRVVVSLHSCGHVMPILEDLMEVGVNVLNPIQSTANDLAEMRSITSGRMTLAGGIDGQRILPFGTPEDVRAEVFRKCDLLWQNGGYLPMAEKMLGVSKENEAAMELAIADWSRTHVES